ncbi:8984_t:CDS:2 [Rhizophagus irregularis]|nr:8984_t:CDS:2 [Rhizophagus irregularis]
MAKKTDTATETTTAVTDTIINTVELATSVAIPLSQFIPLIKDVSEIFSKVTDLYRSAHHNKNITRILMERISAANTCVNILLSREDLLTSIYYKNLQRLVQVLHNMKKFIEEITQYNTVQKHLGAKRIDNEFKELCKEYDSSMTLLSFNLVLVNFNTENEDKIVKEDVEQLVKFQEALLENLVNRSVDQNPGFRPTFSKMLTVLQDIFRSLEDHDPNSNKLPPVRKMIQCTIVAAAEDCEINWDSFNTIRDSFKLPITPPVRKMTQSTIEAIEDCAIDWDSFDYMTLDKAIEYHKNEGKDKQILYKHENELGNYYMISAANKGYEQAINYCKKKNISY